MQNCVRILGVHPIEAEEPVHLIELEVTGDIEAFDVGEITQEQSEALPANWQTAYDERELAHSSDAVRLAFFFHYLQLNQPMQTLFGPVSIPAETPVPSHLREIEYEQP